MSQFHDYGDWESPRLHPSDSRFYKEVKAYENLHKYGVCEGGFVPKYYGFIDQLDPSLDPFLEDFHHDKYHPGALLLEYLETHERLNCVNYSKERHAKAMESLRQVHSALVIQNDMYPRNILIVPGDPERVLIADFDDAITFATQDDMDDAVGSYWPEYIKVVPFEIGFLEEFGGKLVCLIILLYFWWCSLILQIGKRSKRRTSSQHQVLLIFKCSRGKLHTHP